MPSNFTEVRTLEDAVRDILTLIGEDPDREGLQRTPHRVATSWEFLTRGYKQDVKKILNGAVFKEKYNEMVVVKDIEAFLQSNPQATPTPAAGAPHKHDH